MYIYIYLAFATSFKANLFADDTNLILVNKNHKVLEKEVNAELSKIDNWMQINELTINHKKIEFMVITTKKINKFDIVKVFFQKSITLFPVKLH